MVMTCFEITDLFPCQKQHADFIKLSLEASPGSLASWQPFAPGLDA